MPEYWERYGFQRDPFGFQFAEVEDWTWEVANQTFVEHRGLDEILDYSKSSVLLAKPGSGKTALCRYFAGSLRNPYSQISNKPNKPLVVNIVDFTHPALLADRPNMSLDNILATLFDYITEALVDEGKTIDTRLESQVIEH
ncbi:MAG: hypothetical protein M9918_16165, partial [Anaerolineae bacterium]|nr:hypothetical protein [Anaerolineae bacterium]